MNTQDAIVIKVLEHYVKQINDKDLHFYVVEYADMGGEGITRLVFNRESDLVREGYRFRH